MAKLKKDDTDFSLKEMIEYENLFNEPLSDISNDEKPRMEKIAYLAFMKCRRENETLSFKEYINSDPSLEQLQKDAFGELTEEKKEETS